MILFYSQNIVHRSSTGPAEKSVPVECRVVPAPAGPEGWGQRARPHPKEIMTPPPPRLIVSCVLLVPKDLTVNVTSVNKQTPVNN